MFISSDQSMLFFHSDILMVWLMICHFAVGLVSQQVRGFYWQLPSYMYAVPNILYIAETEQGSYNANAVDLAKNYIWMFSFLSVLSLSDNT